ncbi:hypothetical protein IVG45_13345 [Methylomonas sp. LL1]|uniref:hypothetical protein n=1 Tax=Methylomonas sp. LL1 TaxID=2785785 RepID=UPI0018C39C6E|nr:hypothetical protein [Methylomonas sp. LL1]QPK61848.1 hypothetical protein IVG45_13345 [Methylomonas sp. LL1]
MFKSLNIPKPVRILLYAGLIFILLFNLLLLFAIDDTPLLKMHQGLNRDDIQRAKQILHLTPEERDQIKTIVLNQKDINIAVNYLLNHFFENTVQIQVGEQIIFAQIAVFVPKTIWGQYLDFSFKLLQTDTGVKIKSFKIGEISVPDPAANYLIPAIAHTTPLRKYWQLADNYVKDIRFTPDGLQISYLGSMVQAAKQLAIQKHREYPNLHLYQQQINDIVSQHDPAWRLSLMELLQPLFSSAYQRSTDDNAIQENRAVIIAVGSYIYKHELRRYLPLGLVYSKEYQVFAYKRIDIPQHFIASALLAAVDASLLSEQLAVDKELGDAEQGSGFSFIDLTADRAGTRFGQLAIASPKQARELQRQLSEAKDYTAIIPNIQGLPEQMDEPTFNSRFGNTGSQPYRDMIAEIDKRIADLPLYQAR